MLSYLQTDPHISYWCLLEAFYLEKKMTTDLMESVGNGIATLTMNRPAARNALTPQMMMGVAPILIHCKWNLRPIRQWGKSRSL